jgi:methylenetetrahydrofolate dehydrogenase (NADP+)/methenyltetrahydrofolate cyclohydrolase
METRIIDGKAFAAAMTARIAAAVATMDVKPGLAVVLVGDDPASAVYVRMKGRTTLAAGMNSFTHKLPAATTQTELIALVRTLNADPAVDGILVQLPLPAPLDAAAVIAAIDPDKDVDGLTVVNAGRLAAGLPGLVPCTPLGCSLLLRDALGELAGRHAVVIGRSNLVGRPMAQLLLAADCTVTIAHSRSRDLPEICRQADILIAAAGRAELVRGDWIRPGATVIDVGTNRRVGADGKSRLIGDVAFDEALGRAGMITPVPGGVGPMTIACLLRNTLTAARLRAGLGGS